MLIRSLLACLALMTATASADKPPLNETDAVQLFFDAGYSFCDAELLGAAWGFQPYGAKVRTGRFLDLPRGANRVSRFVADQRLQSGRTKVTCDHWSLGMTFSDVEILAAAWGLSIIEAKSKIPREYGANRVRGMWDLLPERMVDTKTYAGKLGYVDYGSPPAEDPRTFTDLDDTRFTHCDAERLARVWQTDLPTAVETLQRKATIYTPADQRASVEALQKVLPSYKCDFHPDFTYTDAWALASQWGVPPDEAKATLGDKLTRGWATYYLVEYAGRPQRVFDEEMAGSGFGTSFVPTDDATAFAAHGWTQCDAATLAHLWNSTEDDARERAGIKLKDSGPYGDLAVYREDARRLAETDGLRCSFSDNYTDEQAARIAAEWSVDEATARSLVEDKLNSGVAQRELTMALGRFWE